MLIVSNTSPISNLAVIGRLEFLQRRYGLIRIPSAVADELGALTHPAGVQHIQICPRQPLARHRTCGKNFLSPTPISARPRRDGSHRARLPI